MPHNFKRCRWLGIAKMPLVKIDPSSKLVFKNEAEGVIATLTLENTSNEYVAFKIKTTAPKLYIVKPNCGKIEPCKDTIIRVTLHPTHDNVKASHRFLVQTVECTEDANLDKEYWSNLSKELVEESKLDVQFMNENENEPSNLPDSKGIRKGLKDLRKYRDSLEQEKKKFKATIENYEENLKKLSATSTTKLKHELTTTEVVMIVALALFALNFFNFF